MNRPASLMIVDDDPIAVLSLHRMIKECGQIRFAPSGEKALDLLQGQPADLVLMDTIMCGMDGFESCETLKEQHPDTSVIFITANGDHLSEVRALQAGAVDFISKPLNPPVILARVRTQLRLKQKGDILRSLVHSDALTGVANRRSLDEQAYIQWQRAKRAKTSIAIMMIDIDHFKAYNDNYGHLQGDKVLYRVAQAIKDAIRHPGDLVARFGGEEFTVLAPGATTQQAMVIADRITAAIRDLAIPHAQHGALTVSIGLASTFPYLAVQSDDIQLSETGIMWSNELLELFTSADKALYEAKLQGRNCVVVSNQMV